MSKLSLYSEYDSYDSESDYQFRPRPWSSRRSFKKKNKRELKIEISELLAKFAQYSRFDTTLSCRYCNHPITSGLIIYIPHIRSKLKTGSLPIDTDRGWDLETKHANRINFLQLIPDTFYFKAHHNSKIDVSYARMVKKPATLAAVVEKEEVWGSRYPNKRYMMNDSIRYHICRILNIITDRCKNFFTDDALEEKHLTKLLFGLKFIAENLDTNQFNNLQHALNEFGKFFHDSRLLFMNTARLQRQISRLEIEFENQLEIHFGEWNTK